jgi:hypothetical protein
MMLEAIFEERDDILARMKARTELIEECIKAALCKR